MCRDMRWNAIGLVIILAFVTVYAVFLDSHKPSSNRLSDNSSYAELYNDSYTNNFPKSQTCQPDDLNCLINQGGGYDSAAAHCARPIERLNSYDVRWTYNSSHPMFSQAHWLSDGHGAIEYLGDRVEFEDKYGAYVNVVYACDLASDNRTVLNARIVRTGHLRVGTQ